MNQPIQITHDKSGRKSPTNGTGVPFNQWIYGVFLNNANFCCQWSESQIQEQIKVEFPDMCVWSELYQPKLMNKFVATQRHRFNHGTLWSGSPQKPQYLLFPINPVYTDHVILGQLNPLRLTTAYGKALTVEQIEAAYRKAEIALPVKIKLAYEGFQNGELTISDVSTIFLRDQEGVGQ